MFADSIIFPASEPARYEINRHFKDSSDGTDSLGLEGYFTRRDWAIRYCKHFRNTVVAAWKDALVRTWDITEPDGTLKFGATIISRYNRWTLDVSYEITTR